MEQIVTSLCKIGYLKSLRGSQGGYKLAKPACEYSIGDILRVTEGNLAPVSCLEDEQNHCNRYEQCVTVQLWEGLYEIINQYLNNIKLSDLANKNITNSKLMELKNHDSF